MRVFLVESCHHVVTIEEVLSKKTTIYDMKNFVESWESLNRDP